jgi:hypothetical protein
LSDPQTAAALDGDNLDTDRDAQSEWSILVTAYLHKQAESCKQFAQLDGWDRKP